MSPELTQSTSEQVNPDVGVVLRGRNNAATRFRPGESGNPGGRPRSALIRRKLIRQLKSEIAAGVDRADCIADGMIEKAITDVAAATFIRDTVDGKPGPADGNNGPTNITVEIALVGGQ